MSGKTRTNFWLDLAMLTLFLAVAGSGLFLEWLLPGGPGSGETVWLGVTRHTWLELHAWLGLGLCAGIAAHLRLHWQWLTCVAGRFFKKLAGPARLNFSLDGLLSGVMFFSGLSGLIPWLLLPSGGYQGGRNPLYQATLGGLTRQSWNELHLWIGLALIAGVAAHFILHWAWLRCAMRRCLPTA